ncbi:hypothetical protein [Photobacterium aquae]|uniref:hypothetical protein n=1 Tax=Photobacterium aquae TaxID=1195763 RepID=UPI00064BF391|nr:hypothetical protein [Photobacterium aquae]
MSRGGAREGAGRKKGEPTEVIRVPVFLVEHIKSLITRYKQDPELYREVFSMSDSEVMSRVRAPVRTRSCFTKKKKKRK